MKMQLPDGTEGFGAGGVQLEVVDGVVDVPAEYVEAAKDHGLTVYVESERKEAKKSKKDDKKTGLAYDDKVSLRFEGDKEDTVGRIVSIDADGNEAVIHVEGMDDFAVDMKFLTKVEG